MTAVDDWNEEGLVENPMIEHLKQLGYTYIHGSVLSQERYTQSDVVMRDRFTKALKRLNPWLSDNNLNKVARTVTHMDATSVMEGNQAFHQLLIDQMSVQQDRGKGRKNQTVYLIDFDNVANNEFLVVNQLPVTTANGTNYPDITLFVNGLPLVVIECKSPKLPPDEQIGEAVRQLKRYQQENERLFYYTQFVIATSNDRARAGTIGASVRHFNDWKDPYPKTVAAVGENPSPQDILVEGVLTKSHLLDLIQNFIVYEPDEGKIIKKMARYQQYRSVNRAVERILHNNNPKERGGIIWATQGSGKSLAMVFLATKLRRLEQLANPIIVVVTDRQDLDRQITNTFRSCGFPNPEQAESVAELKSLLQQGPGTTVMTLVQKFQELDDNERFPELTAEKNVIVMVDESHRTQYSTLAMNMRLAMPNATYIGFTGTPIDKEDKSTFRTFGSYIDKYSIQQAVDDGATVPIFYEARMVDMHVQGESINALFDRYFRDYSEEAKERIKQKYATDDAITASPKRIREITLDIIHHYEQYIRPNGFKAQIVAVSREAAVTYKQMLDELSDYESRVIISGGHNDSETMQEYHLSKSDEKEVINRFKQPLEDDPLSFLIVCDKLLTGFDAPIEQVMYLDKPLKEHNLLQAIARTNRTYDQKTYGLIIDYYGVSRSLEEALGIFHDDDIEGALHEIDAEIPRLEARHRQAMRFFDYINKENLEACLKVLDPENVWQEFDAAFKKFAESMDMVLPDPKAQPYVDDLKWLGKIRQLMKSRRHSETGQDISDCGAKVKELIDEHVYATTPYVLAEPINILSPQFDDKLDELETPEAKAAEMEHAITHEIRIKLDENPVFYTSLKERLEEIIEKRKNEQLSFEEILQEYQDIMDRMRENAKEGESLGFTPEQYPFYQTLESKLEGFGSENLKELTYIITDIIQNNAVIDWTFKEDVKREMRRGIKRQLRASTCPNDQVDNLARQLMALAEEHYKYIR